MISDTSMTIGPTAKPRDSSLRMRVRTSLSIVAVLLLAGCSSLGLLYNRLDTLARFELRSFVSLDDQQRTAFDQQFDALWRWHRNTQLPLYARDLREIAAQSQQPLTEDRVRDISQRLQGHVEAVVRQSLDGVTTMLASLSDAQVDSLPAEMDKRAAKLQRKRAKQDDAEWAEDQTDELEERYEDWSGAVTPEQHQRILQWANALVRPPLDARDDDREAFAELLRQRREPGFGERLSHYLLDPFSAPDSESEARQRQQSRELMVDLSRMATARQRAYLQKKLLDLAAECDRLSLAKN